MIIDGQAVENVKVSFKQEKVNVKFGAERIQDLTAKQEKTAIPTQEQQIILPDSDLGYGALSKVIVEPIPHNYGLVTFNGGYITIT